MGHPGIVRVYYIWMVRNRKLFEDLKPHSDCIVRRSKIHVYKVMFSLYPNVLVHFEYLVMGR